jgi:hypothetical protein
MRKFVAARLLRLDDKGKKEANSSELDRRNGLLFDYPP